jgi:hypothetical protein
MTDASIRKGEEKRKTRDLTALKKYEKYKPSSSDRNDSSSFLYFYGEDGVRSYETPPFLLFRLFGKTSSIPWAFQFSGFPLS